MTKVARPRDVSRFVNEDLSCSKVRLSIVAVWCGAYGHLMFFHHVASKIASTCNQGHTNELQPMVQHSARNPHPLSSTPGWVEHQAKQCQRGHFNPILFDLMLHASKSPGDKGPHARISQHGTGVSVAPLGTEIPAPKTTTKICQSWSPRRKKMSVNVTMKMKRNAIATLKTTWSRRGPMMAETLMWKNII